ncbi:hypothetical protein [Streptomyces sp. NPDC001056]
MVLSISGLVLALILTAVMLRTRYLPAGGALTAASLGYFLAASGAAPSINAFFSAFAAGISSLGHSFG